MGRHTAYSESDTTTDDQHYESIEGMDEDEFFEHYSKPNRRQSKKKNARRLIEKYWEEKDLQDRLTDYHFQSDD